MSVHPTLLTPFDAPREAVYPYRRVWRTALIEIGALVAITGLVLLGMRIIHASLGDTTQRGVGVILALVPLALWLTVSYRGERRASQPRTRLPLVVFLSALLANAVGVPVVDRLFAVDQWLPLANALTRILGYALIAGFTMEFLKFAVLRYAVWEGQITTRQDGIAYSLAAALGYAVVLNLNFVFDQAADPGSVVLRVAGNTLSQAAIGIIVGSALAELKIGKPSVFGLPISLGIAALLHGLFIVARAGVVVGAFSTTASGNLPAASLIVAVALVAMIFSVIGFLVRTADARARRSPAFSR